jgi:hypothetical protein
MESARQAGGLRTVFKVVAVVFFILVLTALLLPIHFRPKPPLIMKCRVELSGLEEAIKGYQATYGNFPSGNRVEVIKALMGNNPRKIQFICVNAGNLSPNGEYLDPWKTPYAFVFSATNGFILSSAGKDKIWGDQDDLIFNRVSNRFVKP